MTDKNDHERNVRIFAGVIGTLLDPDEGVIIHQDGVGYFVYLDHDLETDSFRVMVTEDEVFLQVPNYEKVSKEPLEQEEETVEVLPKHTLQ